MRFLLVPALVALVVNVLLDLYIYCALLSYSRSRVWAKIQAWSALLFNSALIVAICLPKRTGNDGDLMAVMWILYSYLSIYVPKLLFVIFDVLSRLPFLWHKHRWVWMSWTGFVLGILVFVTMWWGALINRYRIQVKEETIEIAHLPQSFNGLKVAQISDLHVGSYGGNTDFVERLVENVNSLHPDVIVFTGDLVNRHSDEALPYMEILSQLNAPMGVFSIMGNHDYGDYYEWPTEDAHKKDVAKMKKRQGDLGWKMLNNAYAWLRQESDSIALIGVENVGDPPFHTYGSLKDAYPNLNDGNIKILLSHNPAHWESEIEDNVNSNVHLTLSGHTHAMQMEAFGISPAALRYRNWGGLYKDKKGQQLYVNIGAGEVGFPSRIGATPEITLFTLKPSQK